MMKNKKKITSVLFTVFRYVMLIAAAIISLLPVVVCVLTAFKTTDDYNTSSVLDLPKQWMAENFSIAMKQANMLQGFMNTAIVLVVVLTCSILISAMLAYVLNRFKFRGSGLIQNLFMFASLIPGIATQVTVYQIMFSLGLINHLYGYMIVLMGTDIISIYIFLQFFENHYGRMYLFRRIFQNFVPAFKACDRYFPGTEGRERLQRVLYVQPVSADKRAADHIYSPLRVYRTLRESVQLYLRRCAYHHHTDFYPVFDLPETGVRRHGGRRGKRLIKKITKIYRMEAVYE